MALLVGASSARGRSTRERLRRTDFQRHAVDDPGRRSPQRHGADRPHRHRRRGHPRPLPRPAAGPDRKHDDGRSLHGRPVQLRHLSCQQRRSGPSRRSPRQPASHCRRRRARSTTSCRGRPSPVRSGSSCAPRERRWRFAPVFIRGTITAQPNGPNDVNLQNVVLNQPRQIFPARHDPGRHHRQLADADAERRRHARAEHLLPDESDELRAATSKARVISYLDQEVTKESSFTPTGCEAVPFDPFFAIDFNPTTVGQLTRPITTRGDSREPAPAQPVAREDDQASSSRTARLDSTSSPRDGFRSATTRRSTA